MTKPQKSPAVEALERATAVIAAVKRGIARAETLMASLEGQSDKEAALLTAAKRRDDSRAIVVTAVQTSSLMAKAAGVAMALEIVREELAGAVGGDAR